jgi:ornithine carbamoyltransferase
MEAKGKLEGLKLAYIGDGNNVCNSLLLGCAIAGMNMSIACPKGYEPNNEIFHKATEIGRSLGADMSIVRKPDEAAKNADVLYTDVWVSMGEEKERQKRMKAFRGYQINAGLLSVAAENAVVMHCLPAHRGLEITDAIIEGKQSIIWAQGENKLYGAAAILDFLLS